jgi:hypothetical protein
MGSEIMNTVEAFGRLLDDGATTYDASPLVGTSAERDTACQPLGETCLDGENLLLAENPEFAVSQWQQILDSKLIEWSLDPAYFSDSGIPPLSRAALHWANATAIKCRREFLRPACRVSPTIDGGIVFEWKWDNTSMEIDFSDDGNAYLAAYVNDELVAELVKELPPVE